MVAGEREHVFSVELKSKQHLKSIQLGNGKQDQVFIEGFLGELRELKFVEESMLEIKGANGILRLDVSRKEVSTHLKGLKGG